MFDGDESALEGGSKNQITLGHVIWVASASKSFSPPHTRSAYDYVLITNASIRLSRIVRLLYPFYN